MLKLADNAPVDAFPAGFKGLPQYNDAGLYEGAKFGNILYKTKTAQEIALFLFYGLNVKL